MPEVDVGLLRTLLAKEKQKNKALEARVEELTEFCREWREHHDYVVQLRLDCEAVCEPSSPSEDGDQGD